MSPRFEAALARLYVDADARRRFLVDPEGEALRTGLAPEERTALLAIDRAGLTLASESFVRKRAAAKPRL